MSSKEETINHFLSQYDHREPSSLGTDLDAQRILEGYAEQRDIPEYEFIDSEAPYYAALGSASDSDAEILSITHYLQPVEDETKHRASGHLDSTSDLSDRLERQIPDEKVLESAGIEIKGLDDLVSPSGEKLYPGSIHCMVFYSEPDMDPLEFKKRMDFDDLVHRSVAVEAVKNSALGTAIVLSGREKSALQVDYWPRPIDTQIQDYGEINWDNPGEI